MSGVQLAPSDGQIVLPNGATWAPPAGTDATRCAPRVCYVPASYSRTAGQECIDLAQAAGLTLDPWQQLCIILGLGQTAAGRWAAFQAALIVARQNGKGSILEALELYWLFIRGERLIGHSAHEYKTAMEAFRRVLGLIEGNDWLRKRVKKVVNTNGEEGIELLTGERLRFMARSKGAGRGFTFHKLVWDEAYALTGEQQDAQLPTMSAVPDPQIWITSSPPLTSDTGEVMFRLRRQVEAGAGQLVFLDYGAAGSLEDLENVPLDDEALWLATNPASPHRISLETMRRERLSMGETGFARERLCIWPPDLTQGFGIITKAQWEAMLDPKSGDDLTGAPVFAVDVSPRNAGQVRSTIAIAAFREDGKRHIEIIKTGSGTAWLVADLVTLAKRHKAVGIIIDPGSPAGSILADLEAAVAEEVVYERLPEDLIVTMAARDVAQAFGMIYDAANAKELSVTHIGQSELTMAVGGGVKRPVGDGHAWDRRTATMDITPLVSVTHALWGLSKCPQPETEQVLVAWG